MARLTHIQPVIGNEKINIQNWLAQAKAKILISGFKFAYDESDVALKQFFNMLENHNDFEKLLWTSEIQNSIYGKSYIFFDMLANSIPKIGIYEYNPANQCLRIDGITPIYIKASRVVLSGCSGITSKIWEYRTPHSVKRLIQSGTAFNETIPMSEAGNILTPPYVKELLKIGETKQEFVGLSASEILNKDSIDFFVNNQESALCDDFNVKELRDYINKAYQWNLQELLANHTRIIGDFSNQDINQLEKEAGVKNPWDKQDNFGGDFLNKILFVRTRGNDSRIEVQQANLDIEKQVAGLNKIIDLYFQGCGLDSALLLDGSGQKSVAEVQTTYKTTFETIKKTNQLRTKQWSKFIETIMSACGLEPSEYRGKWKFQIVSEILNDSLSNPDTILQLHTARLMTTHQALSNIYKDYTEQQIFELEDKLKQEVISESGAISDNLRNDQNSDFENGFDNDTANISENSAEDNNDIDRVDMKKGGESDRTKDSGKDFNGNR